MTYEEQINEQKKDTNTKIKNNSSRYGKGKMNKEYILVGLIIMYCLGVLNGWIVFDKHNKDTEERIKIYERVDHFQQRALTIQHQLDACEKENNERSHRQAGN